MAETVTCIRTFHSTKQELGVGFDGHSWFVYDRTTGESDWHTHCGPYSNAEQATQWINDIREVKRELY